MAYRSMPPFARRELISAGYCIPFSSLFKDMELTLFKEPIRLEMRNGVSRSRMSCLLLHSEVARAPRQRQGGGPRSKPRQMEAKAGTGKARHAPDGGAPKRDHSEEHASRSRQLLNIGERGPTSASLAAATAARLTWRRVREVKTWYRRFIGLRRRTSSDRLHPTTLGKCSREMVGRT